MHFFVLFQWNGRHAPNICVCTPFTLHHFSFSVSLSLCFTFMQCRWYAVPAVAVIAFALFQNFICWQTFVYCISNNNICYLSVFKTMIFDYYVCTYALYIPLCISTVHMYTCAQSVGTADSAARAFLYL